MLDLEIFSVWWCRSCVSYSSTMWPAKLAQNVSSYLADKGDSFDKLSGSKAGSYMGRRRGWILGWLPLGWGSFAGKGLLAEFAGIAGLVWLPCPLQHFLDPSCTGEDPVAEARSGSFFRRTNRAIF